MSNRSADATIRGYFYQFDNSIERLLLLTNDSDTITIEGIEDIDLCTATEEVAIQCKYYSKTDYNHSVIARPIRLMLSHFKELKMANRSLINYQIYGYFKADQNKLVLPINVDFLKRNFLTYKEEKVERHHHQELGMSDDDLRMFISHLIINIEAKEYDDQLRNIIALLQHTFSCSEFEAEKYYYNSALNVIKNLAIEPGMENRRISKGTFLSRINQKEILFNTWYVKLKGRKAYLNDINRQYFRLNALNMSPFERFFLIEVDDHGYSRSDLKTLLLGIQKKWSKLSLREQQSFCPYVYIHGISANELVAVKTCLRDENIYCIDGFDFCGASFKVQSLMRQATYHNCIKIKIVNDLHHLDLALAAISKTKEVYQFYVKSPFYLGASPNIKHVKIQVENLKDVKEILE